MKKYKALTIFTLLLITNLLILSTPVVANGNSKPIVVCTNTLLGSFASEVGGDNVTVISIMPPGICPAHYDISPADIYAVSNATLLLDSGIEPWISDLVAASGNDNVTQVSIGGTWHPYLNGIAYLNSVKAAMIEALPAYTSHFISNYEQAKNTINTTAQTLKQQADTLNVSQFNVICMQWQSAFVSWLGFNVTATYPPPETISTAQILELTAIAEVSDIALVIDNLPSGTSFGAKLASDIGAQHVILTNFPLAVPNTENYSSMITYNAIQLFEAAEEHQLIQGEINQLTTQLAIADLQIKLLLATSIVLITIVVIETLIITRKPRK